MPRPGGATSCSCTPRRTSSTTSRAAPRCSAACSCAASTPPDGTLDPDAMAEHVHSDADPHWAPTRLVALENTHNHCGGLVYPAGGDPGGAPLLRPQRPAAAPRRRPHLERPCGRRRAAGGDRRPLRHRQRVPVEGPGGTGGVAGALPAPSCCRGSIRARKLLGGGMRQAGILAAAGLYALEHNIDRMAEDHRRARLSAERLARVPGLRVDLGKVQTNMVYADTRGFGNARRRHGPASRRSRRLVPGRGPVDHPPGHPPRRGRRRRGGSRRTDRVGGRAAHGPARRRGGAVSPQAAEVGRGSSPGAGRHPGDRLLQGRGRPLLHDAARRSGRRRHQGRAARGGRRLPLVGAAVRRG